MQDAIQREEICSKEQEEASENQRKKVEKEEINKEKERIVTLPNPKWKSGLWICIGPMDPPRSYPGKL